MNESTDVLQLYELSKLCDGTPNCYLGSDELRKELKCTGIFFNSELFVHSTRADRPAEFGNEKEKVI